MRPFRFFFVLSLGIFIFLFIARFLVMALVAAAILSFGYVLFRKIGRFFYRLDWHDQRHDLLQHGRYFPVWRYDREPLFELPYQHEESIARYRKIEIQ